MANSLPHPPSQVIAQLFVDLGLGEARTSSSTQPAWPVSYDNEPTSPNDLIHVNDTTPLLFQGDSHGGRNGQEGLQIVVRAGTAAIGWPKANAVKVALDEFKTTQVVTITNADDTTTRYCVNLIRRVSGPLRMGPEGNTTRRRYTINILAHMKLFDA